MFIMHIKTKDNKSHLLINKTGEIPDDCTMIGVGCYLEINQDALEDIRDILTIAMKDNFITDESVK